MPLFFCGRQSARLSRYLQNAAFALFRRATRAWLLPSFTICSPPAAMVSSDAKLRGRNTREHIHIAAYYDARAINRRLPRYGYARA